MVDFSQRISKKKTTKPIDRRIVDRHPHHEVGNLWMANYKMLKDLAIRHAQLSPATPPRPVARVERLERKIASIRCIAPLSST